ncbi:MAG: T9SS type A sorting domain-containing protein, partial [candidate division WOR-3 bacterium]
SSDNNIYALDGTVPGVEENVSIPQSFFATHNYPNPFRTTTAIEYSIPQDVHVNITIYNLAGQKIVTLVNERIQAGHHSVRWDARDEVGREVSSGVYFLKFAVSPVGTTGSGGETGDCNETRKLLLIR